MAGPCRADRRTCLVHGVPVRRLAVRLTYATALVAGLLLCAAPAGATVPEAGGDRPARPGTSTVLPGNFADPTLAVFGRTYYLYPTTDGDAGPQARFTVWSSTDLVHWRDRGTALSLGPDVSWADRDAWAPAIAERGGKYFLYFTAEQKIGVAVGDTPAGPFRDIGHPLVPENPGRAGQAIDPAVFTDTDGTPYLYWGNGSAFVVPLNPDMVSFDPAKVRRIDGLDGFGEGMFVRERGGTYHLTWSIGAYTSSDYRVGYATATSPAGPFTNRGVILSKDERQGILGTGHDSVLQIPGTDEWVMAYHRFGIPGGDGMHREIAIDRLPITPDGLFGRVTPTLTGLPPRPVG